MKKLLGILVLSLLLSGNAYTQETALICELKKYFSRKNRKIDAENNIYVCFLSLFSFVI